MKKGKVVVAVAAKPQSISSVSPSSVKPSLSMNHRPEYLSLDGTVSDKANIKIRY